MHLHLMLLGPFEVTLEGKPAEFATDRARALLTYLAVEAGRPHRREALAGLFWSDRPEKVARANLSQALARLRRAIDDYHADPPFLDITPKTIEFSVVGVALDVADFSRLIATCTQHGHAQLETCSACVRRLEQAVALYRGDLVQGLLMDSGSLFEEWLLLTREQLHRQAMEAFYALSYYHLQAAHYVQAETYARHQLALEPWREEAHCQLMRALAAGGQRTAALAQYRTCRQILKDELGVEPMAETEALYQDIRGGTLPLPEQARAVSGRADDVTPDDWPDAAFVGREQELSWLQTVLDVALAGRGQVALIRGEVGSGKTALACEFARRAAVQHPDLLVANGRYNAHNGLGDPYLPCREVMSQPTGDAEMPWATGAGNGAPGNRFEHLAPALQKLVARQPLLLVLDDLHWADGPSLALLFSLGRQIADSRIMVLGTYRPEEVVDSGAHAADSLPAIVGEFKRMFGRIEMDLEWASSGNGRQSASRQFVDALLDTQPNRLDEPFRQALAAWTGGQPLFTTELLRDMRDRGDLRLDTEGRWMAGPNLEWRHLPARVEGVIERRLGRLSPDLRAALRVACVEGQEFTAEVIARVQRTGEQQVIRLLSTEAVRRQRLLSAPTLQWAGSQPLSRYSFRHPLVQEYLYQTLDEAERVYLHGAVGQALVTLYGDQVNRIAPQLARHFRATSRPHK